MQNNQRLSLSSDTSLLRGIVVNTQDPDNQGRVQIRIPPLHGVPNQSNSWIEDEFLPWAVPGNLLGAGNNIGQRIVPIKGTRVFVLFEGGSTSTPVYLGGIPLRIGEPKLYNDEDNNVFSDAGITIKTDDTISDFDLDSAQSAQGVLFKSIKGFTIYYNDTDGKEVVKIFDQAGQSIIMEALEPVTSHRDGREPLMNSRISITHASGIKIVLDNDNIQLKNKDSILEVNAEDGFLFITPSDVDVEGPS